VSGEERELPKALRGSVLAILLLPICSAAAVFWLAPVLYEKETAQTFAHRKAAWAGSQTCQSCHPDQYASWHRTFHRTMTQAATPQSVLGAFDGKVVTFYGVPARPLREGDRYFIEYLDPTSLAVTRRLEVVKTVGSRRYQQYVVQGPPGAPGNNLYRIPLLWHIGDQRWIHLNGAFLHGDDAQSYDSHTAIWNQNCIFCHNTGPNPGVINYDAMKAAAARGEAVNSATDSLYDSHVAEMGIACESCHAPGGEHARRNRNPLRRYFFEHDDEAGDPTIVDPARLEPRRSVEVCGQCHGQRLPDPPASVERWMRSGPVYRAGENLLDSVAPVSMHTPGPPDQPDMFRLRFWPDGSPRLTAYEYQGVVASKCYLEDPRFTCNSCHEMHGGDVRGQIAPEKRTNQACAGCHGEIVAKVAEHSHHLATSTGASCYDCHMPKRVYGVLEIHRSHQIESPDAAHDAASARPNACTNCHLDQSLVWAAEKSAQFWGAKYSLPVERADGAPVQMADSVASLLAGDPVQRAVAARLAGRRDTPLSPQERAFLKPLLLYTMENSYPTIRYFAHQSLLALDAERPVAGMREWLEGYDYLAPPAVRRQILAALWQAWRESSKDGLPKLAPEVYLLDPSYALLEPEVAKLAALQIAKEIHIGE